MIFSNSKINKSMRKLITVSGQLTAKLIGISYQEAIGNYLEHLFFLLKGMGLSKGAFFIIFPL
jgi:hypothetical protein